MKQESGLETYEITQGEIGVGVSKDDSEVVLKFPELPISMKGPCYVTFTPEQALSFAETIAKNAHEAIDNQITTWRKIQASQSQTSQQPQPGRPGNQSK